MKRIIGTVAFAALVAAALMGSSLWAGDPTWTKEPPTELADTSGYYFTGHGHQIPASTTVTTSYHPIEFTRHLLVELSYAPLGNAELHLIPIYNGYYKTSAGATASQNLCGYALPLTPTDRITRTSADPDTRALYVLDVQGKGGLIGFQLDHTGATTISHVRVQVKGGM